MTMGLFTNASLSALSKAPEARASLWLGSTPLDSMRSQYWLEMFRESCLTLQPWLAASRSYHARASSFCTRRSSR